nr:hypothetical protein [uncultured Flavobacterium sp.]
MKKLLYYLTLLLSLHTFVSKAQVLDYVILNQEQGLTTTFIHCLYIDSRGIQWVGTGGHGLLRYDGKQYVKINESFGIDSYNITGIIEDKKGNLILKVLNYGLIVFDGKEIIKKIPISNTVLGTTSSCMVRHENIIYTFTSNAVYALYTDKNYRYDLQINHIIKLDIHGLPNTVYEILDIIQLDNVHYIACYIDGIVILDSKFNYVKHINSIDNKPLGVVNAINKHNDNKLILGGSSEIYSLNLKDNSFTDIKK